MWALTHMYGSVQYQLSIILWRAHIKSQFILYRVDVNWMKEIYSILFYSINSGQDVGPGHVQLSVPHVHVAGVQHRKPYNSHPLRIIVSFENKST
jgi:hypothetical protein